MQGIRRTYMDRIYIGSRKKLAEIASGTFDTDRFRKFLRGLPCPSHNSDDLDIAQAPQCFRVDASHKSSSENCCANLFHLLSPRDFNAGSSRPIHVGLAGPRGCQLPVHSSTRALVDEFWLLS